MSDTLGQWSDGIGAGRFDGLEERLGVKIDLASIDREDLVVEQIDNGEVVRPPQTALSKAVRDGNLAKVIRLLDDGADIEARVQGYTPLHFAVLHGFAAVALELVRRGADVRARDPTGEDALMLTALSNRISDTDAARVALLARGADVLGPPGKDAIPRAGQYTPLYIAENRNKEMLAVVLREFGDAH